MIYSSPELWVGAVSPSVVDAGARIARTHAFNFVIMASRRQVESKSLGGGYSHNWSTREWVDRVQTRARCAVRLARDHGGPWLGFRVATNLATAVDEAKESIKDDIRCGLAAVHIDVGEVARRADLRVARLVMEDLLRYTVLTAADERRAVEIEVSFQCHSADRCAPSVVERDLDWITTTCSQSQLPMPRYLVLQTGSFVSANRNSWSEEPEPEGYAAIAESIALIRSCGMLPKEHNADFLSVDSLRLRHKLGIGAINIAPQLAVAETDFLVGLCNEYGLSQLLDELASGVEQSQRWRKWFPPDATPTSLEKVRAAAHYSFSTQWFREWERQLAVALHQSRAALHERRVVWIESHLQGLLMALGHAAFADAPSRAKTKTTHGQHQ